jgi:hypothetical protein
MLNVLIVQFELFFLVDLIGVFVSNANMQFVIDEGKDHAIIEGDQVTWFVVVHLVLALHEDECAV